jgi:hypothetical protein
MKAEASIGTVRLTGDVRSAAETDLQSRVYEDWHSLPSGTERLFDAASARSVFLSRPWFYNLAQNSLCPMAQVRFITVVDGSSKPALLLPVYCHDEGVLTPRTVEGLTNFYTPLFEPLISANCDRARALDAMARAIVDRRNKWDVASLRWLDKDSPLFSELVESFRRAGFIVQTYLCSGNWYEPVAGRDFQQYLQKLRSSVRNIARSKAKKVERSGRARLEVVRSCEALGPAIQAYNKVYNSSWKNPEPFPEFMPGLFRSFAQAGWLRLGLAYVDGEPAAAQVWLVANGVASIYKIAYDPKFKDLSIGTYLTLHMMHNAIDVEKVSEIDYLTGDDRYKQDWMSRRRERWGILAMNPRTLKGGAAIIRHVGGRFIKRQVKGLIESLRSGKQKNINAVPAPESRNSKVED